MFNDSLETRRRDNVEMALSWTALPLISWTETSVHFFTHKQSIQRGSINNSSMSYHQRIASSEECCFANEQKTTVNRNSSDSLISFQLSLFVALDALMFCVPVGCNSIHSSTLRLPEASNLGFTHPLPLPPLCTDDGWRMEQWICPPPTYSNRHFKVQPHLAPR